MRKREIHGYTSTENMVFACLTEKGDCLRDLGWLDDAAKAYEDGLLIFEKINDKRGVS